VFGIAGACDKAAADQLMHLYQGQFAQLTIVSDATTSVYGANGGKPVVVVALGTGSVGMRLEPSMNNVLVGGWGFLLGDEGSGAKLTLHAIQACVEELEYSSGEQSLLGQLICRRLGPSKVKILAWARRASPTEFALYTQDIFKLYGQCKVADRVIEQHIASVEALISRTRGSSTLPVVLLGGLGMVSKSLLCDSTKAQMINAWGTALDGACLLAKQALGIAPNNQTILDGEIAHNDG